MNEETQQTENDLSPKDPLLTTGSIVVPPPPTGPVTVPNVNINSSKITGEHERIESDESVEQSKDSEAEVSVGEKQAEPVDNEAAEQSDESSSDESQDAIVPSYDDLTEEDKDAFPIIHAGDTAKIEAAKIKALDALYAPVEEPEPPVVEAAPASVLVPLGGAELPVVPDEPVVQEPVPEKKSKRLSAKTRKAIKVACGGLAAALAVVYLGGAFYFSQHFMANTKLNGEDVSGMSAEQLAQQKENITQGYSVHVTGPGVNFDITSSDIDLQSDPEAYAQQAVSSVDNWAWPASLAQQHSYDIDYVVNFDEGKLDGIVTSAVKKANKNAVKPTNAELSYDKETKTFSVVQKEKGTTLDTPAVLQAVKSSISALDVGLTLGEEQLKKPAVTADNPKLVKAASKANGYLNIKIPIQVDKKTVFTIDSNLISKWVTVDENFKVKLDHDALDKWAYDYAAKCNTRGGSRTYKIPGTKRKVKVSGGNYGWTVDTGGFPQEVVDRVNTRSNEPIKLSATSKGAVWNPGSADWGNRYIDVDLGDQYARMFGKKGKLIWESDIVSGNVSSGHGTPSGVYTINGYMATNQLLVGADENKDGEPDYETPVDYWMPFVDNQVALHDAGWRGSFGGGIYRYDGSHGCVNLPYSKAQKLFGMVKVGDVVVVHW